MSIFVRSCGHSAETSSRAYFKNPEKCMSCDWIAKNGEPKRLYDQNLDGEKRARTRERLKTVSRDVKGRILPKKAV